jgi:hypothetical protein
MGDVGNDDSEVTEDYVTRDEIQDRARELAKRKEVRFFIFQPGLFITFDRLNRAWILMTYPG